MVKRAVAVACLLVLSLCGCNASAVANWTGLQPAVEPPNVETVTYKDGSLEVPTDWEVMDDASWEDLGVKPPQSTLINTPYGGNLDLFWGSGGSSVEALREHYDENRYMCERDGLEIVADEIVGDDQSARGVFAYIDALDDGKERELVEAFVIEDGREASVLGGVPTSCTENQIAEFNWVVNSLAISNE